MRPLTKHLAQGSLHCPVCLVCVFRQRAWQELQRQVASAHSSASLVRHMLSMILHPVLAVNSHVGCRLHTLSRMLQAQTRSDLCVQGQEASTACKASTATHACALCTHANRYFISLLASSCFGTANVKHTWCVSCRFPTCPMWPPGEQLHS